MTQWIAVAALLASAALWAGTAPAQDTSLARQIFDTMAQTPGYNPAYRAAHAKGIVCEGTFTAAKGASGLSRAAHFQGGAVRVTVRFSNASVDPFVADSAPNPRGMAIRFRLPGGGQTDLVMLSHNGFIVGTGEDFLALQKAIVATDPGEPHPWPIEAFVGSRPLAATSCTNFRARGRGGPRKLRHAGFLLQ